jgi:hypothetical protein
MSAWRYSATCALAGVRRNPDHRHHVGNRLGVASSIDAAGRATRREFFYSIKKEVDSRIFQAQ